MKALLKKIENWLEKMFCNPNDCTPMSGVGGRKAGLTNEERNLG